ncbi:hypothetical protein PACTADRAFT_49838 [Pachysolen tannophilus NRRL Y-2460]|uniref:Eukaryotic translation initiation factor 3 subunit D n=1 Tax=Pachysolen tannophilus NRRL Y-2460 TaxID=669874 RepID=A0A1E4TXN3_PACTA|nr:hypothetical protein PACTADRAFT_49838 [Pachysolen tannophilus NRRL Y-2460]
MSTELPFLFNSLASTTSTWGPPKEVPESLRFNDIPYAPFSKGDKLGKAADWNTDQSREKEKSKQMHQRGQRDQYHAYGVSAASSFAAEVEDDGEFSVVDKNAPSKTTTVLRGRSSNKQRPNTLANKLASSGNKKMHFNANNNKPNAFAANRRRQPYHNNWNNKNDDRKRESSVKVLPDWQVISEIEFNKLAKLNLDVVSGEDVVTYGSACPYDKKFERLNGSQNSLPVLDRVFYNPTASDDPVIQQLSENQTELTIYSTDSVISQLMCASRSVYSWDIVIVKNKDKIFIDKRDGSILDRISVDENSNAAPSDSHDSDINNANNLSLEATYINQNFVTASILENNAPKYKFEHKENPFVNDDEVDENEPLLQRGYRYRKFVLPSANAEEEPYPIVIRTEIDSYTKESTNAPQFLSIHALNQYLPGSLDWKQKLTQQRGAIMAAEMKKNNNKISKWSIESILAGIDAMKIGFVARANVKDNSKHSVLGVTQYKPTDLALQMNLSINNGWGIVRSIIDMILNYSQDDYGKFLVLKDPNSPKMTLYKVAENAFADNSANEDEDEILES